MTQTRLKLSTITRAMDLRADHYKNTRGEIVSCRDWSAADDFTALIGEIGEAANIVKKIRRGDFTLDEARPTLAKEFADIQCYICRFADRRSVDLDAGTPDAFDFIAHHADTREHSHRTLSDCMTFIATMAGFAGSHLEDAIVQGNGSPVKMTLAECLNYLQRRLILAAIIAGVDLAAATIDKFNEVSVRVGSPVRVDQDGVYAMPEVKGNTESAGLRASHFGGQINDSVDGSDF